ncbi:LytTR family DNA-binding domain-containing protein [uncultured Aquimarina sp.]|uniref:LytTR family DNA-binding domain-containing protein n=1 Tax=uncultured Aquimarina sp. TaxID=575652 RepID=UPI00261C993A|nr:LytTR family DNA-binding domain-containing protein [uncultured Aquimarina sp.]
MSFNNAFPYNSSYKIHIIIGIILGLLLGFILIALQPFNINNYEHEYGEVLLMGFGVVKFVNYLLAHVVANYFYKQKNNWTLWNEITFLILSSLSATILGYIYLDTIFEKQPLSFLRLVLFLYYLVLPIFPLIVFPKSVLRYLLIKNIIKHPQKNTSEMESSSSERLTLMGQNAKDKLVISKEDLLYIKSIDNYVMVYYTNEQIKSIMLRAKLSEILTQASFLIQPHRSYLINPMHSFKVKGNSQKAVLISQEFEEVIPIARTSYKKIKDLFH